LTTDTEKYNLEDFISELSQISYTDLLIQVNPENKSVILIEENFDDVVNLPFSSKLNQILKIAINHKKVSDIQSLCLCSYLLKWTFRGKILNTPIFLSPITYKQNKIKNICEFKRDKNEFFINPFLIKSFKTEFDIDLEIDNQENNFDFLIKEFQENLKKHEFDFEIITLNLIGNFHHHRYEILKDLEELINSKNENQLVRILLGDETESSIEKIELSKNNCFETDSDQKEIFKLIENNNLLVQGPPGTGKTQVLANLLSKLLLKNEKQLLVSEKKVALSVLFKKLESRNLHHFAFVFSSDVKNGDFIKHLKKTWTFLENLELEKKINLNLSEQYLQQIQQYLDKLNHVKLFGNLSLSEIQGVSKSDDFSKIRYNSNLPEYDIWLDSKNVVEELFRNLKNPFLVSYLKNGTYRSIENFDTILTQTIQDFKLLSEKFALETPKDLEILFKQTLRVQLIENEQNKKYFELILSKSKQNKFLKLQKQYKIQVNKLEFVEKELDNWIKIPNLSEIETFISDIEKTNFIVKIKAKSRIKKFLKNKHVDLYFALKNLSEYHKINSEKLKIENELIALGIENPNNELSYVSYLIQQIYSSSENELNLVYNFDEAKKSNLITENKRIEKFRQTINTYFNFDENTKLNDILSSLLENLPQLIHEKNKISKLSAALIENFKNVENFEAFELSVLKSNWIKFTSIYPEFSNFTGEKLKELLNKTIQFEKSENELFSEEILLKKLADFRNFNQLLATNSTKLNASQKELKKKLKTGKSILVKEFSKSKQHRSLRELLSSDAQLWIDLLCPIHLSTPLMVSRNYTLNSDLFQFVIFDEASQLVLPKAISCVQRAKRMLIAGDAQQMSPSSYFMGKISSVDLLHQASYYLPKTSLKHHYRSIHGELIKFSNKYFYNNELIVYPSSEKKEQVIQFHYLENATFENRENPVEAKEVARFLMKNIDSKKTIGLVTFSEQQLICIYKQFNSSELALIEEKIKNKLLFFRTLEQVQGEECDHLIISFAYGKDTNGKFHLRFGPLNQTNGSKRLNVLFTRAKERIDFFSSVKSSDFELSANESINLLRIYLQDIENQQNHLINYIFPYGISPKFEGNKLKIKSIHEKIDSAEELKTFHSMMLQRKWKIIYEL
jgi:superfamily I DNA and/or RNA helicase